MVRIGSYELPSNIILAPMAGCADLPFRLICREHGARFAFFEMIDCNCVIHSQEKNLAPIIMTTEDDSPIAIQLLGEDPDKAVKAAKEVLKLVDVPFIDLNAACPVKKVVKKKAGSYLLKDLKKLGKIVKALAAAIKVPVTVKLRVGYEKVDAREAAKVAKTCESSGASAIFVHGRTRAQLYSGGIDYASIKAMKDSARIPVFGSGNVFDALSAKRMLDETSCDGVMVARGALGNPWIFSQIEEYLKNGREPKPVDLTERKKVLKKHLSYIERYNDQKPAGRVGFMRKAALWYLKGFPNAAKMRHQISLVKSYDEMLKLVDAIPH